MKVEQLCEKYRPRTLDAFAGMERTRAILASFAAKPYSSAWLLLGPSGTGKTTMALALADELGGETYHVASKACDLATVEDVVRKCHYRPWSGNWNFVLVDEADQMSRAAQLAFLSKLDTTAAPPDTIFFFTANATNLLEDRFLSRCRTVNFSTDGLLNPLTQLLRDIWTHESSPNWRAPDFALIAQQSKLNVRAALMSLELELMAGGCVQDSPALPARVAPASCASEDFIDSYTLAAVLKIGVATLYKRVQQGKLPPPNRDGRRMAWRRSEVLA